MKITKWLVSILICTYNAEETIKKTIQSCLHQTYSHSEILIHDDQSKDNTVELIKNMWDTKIKIINSWRKLGPYWWLNFLLDHASGEYIAIQDHDDLWHPEKLQKQIKFLESEQWRKYLWCGTKTLMRYESDQQWFEYFLWQENYYTIHPSLVFRNQWQRYPTDSVYMNDALFQKTVLCNGEKKIYNIDETLTFHRIKDGASNLSYKWFRYSLATIRTVLTLHPVWYGVCIIWWETMRKIVYPVLQWVGRWKWIDVLERKPFEMMGNTTHKYHEKKRMGMGFIKN